MSFVFLLLFCILSTFADKDRVRLKDVTALTFHRGQYTNARRGLSIPQLECIGGTASTYKSLYPTSAQCYNRGHDGRDVQWECKAELSKNVRFGRTTVSCEGYSYPEDPYVLHGSCGLQYELDFKDGYERSSSREHKRHFSFKNFVPSNLSLPGFSPYLALAGLLILAVVIWSYCLRDTTEQTTGPIGFEEIPRPPPSTAPYPNDEPPSYDEATGRPFLGFADSFTRQRPTSSNYRWRRNSPPYPSGSSNYHPKEQTQSSSWFSNSLAAGAGFLGGYFMGSRDREPRQHSSTSRLYPDLNNLGDETNFDAFSSTTTTTRSDPHRSRQVDDDDSYVATSFATTSRR